MRLVIVEEKTLLPKTNAGATAIMAYSRETQECDRRVKKQEKVIRATKSQNQSE